MSRTLSSPSLPLSSILRPITSHDAVSLIARLTSEMEDITNRAREEVRIRAEERDELVDTLLARKWSTREVSRGTGLSQSRVTQIRNRDRKRG